MFGIILSFLFIVFSFVSVYPQNTDNVSKAKTFVDLLAKKDFVKAETYFSDEVKAQLSAEKLAEVLNSLTPQIGNFKNQASVKSEKSKDWEIVVVTVEFEKANLDFQMSFNQKGEIGGFFFRPSQTPGKSADTYKTPEYVQPNAFQEREVTVGAGEWALPATLTMPNGKGNFPIVVLVHGSGANDRDETHINPANKPFKDLAWGLASKGIAVLRYEKRSRQYPEKFAVIKKRTVDDETVNDALAAVRLLRQTPDIDQKNIYVLGHSLGGMMIPRIGVKDKQIAGLIVFAGTARPLEDVILEQYTYLFSLDGNVTPEEQKFLDAAKKGVAEVKSLTPTNTNSNSAIIGFPATYWLDWKSYNPSLVAKTLEQPLLILQGERDYQVTMTDFQNWKNALGKNKFVTFKTYPKLNHLFMLGEGTPSPADYEKTNHVSAEVISDIAAWIMKGK
jgi:dienelactone hydrolase